MLTIALLLASLSGFQRTQAEIEFNESFVFAQIKMLDSKIEEVESQIEELESKVADPELLRNVPAYRLLEARLDRLEEELFQLNRKLSRLPFE